MLYFRATPAPVLVYAQDVPVLAEMGSRWLQGLAPHADFYSAFGPALYALLGGAMHLAGGRAVGVAWAPLLVALICLCLALVGSYGRPGAVARGASYATLVAMALGVRAVNQGPGYVTYAGQYNRFGMAALAALQLALLLPFDQAREGAPWWRRPSTAAGAASALIATTLLWFKPNYGAAAGLLCAVAAALQPALRRGAAARAFIAGSVVAHAWGLTAIRGDLSALVHDLRLAAIARSSFWTREVLTFTAQAGAAGAVAPLVIAAALAALGAGERRTLLATGVAGSLVALTLLLGDSITPTSIVEAPLAGLLCAILLARAARSGVRPLGVWLAASTALVLVAVSLMLDVSAFRLAASLQAETTARLPELSLPGRRWEGLALSGYRATACWNRPREMVLSGVSLLRESGLGEARVLVFDFSDPLGLARDAPSPLGAPPWWHAGINFSAAAHPSPAQVFRDVAAVMIPVCPTEPSTTALLLSIYRDDLTARFRPLRRNAQWMLLSRR